MRPPRTLSRLIANAAQVATNSVITPTATAMQQRVPDLQPEVVEVEVLLLEHDARSCCSVGLSGHSCRRERRVLRRDREQEDVVDRHHRPEQHRDADQQQLGLVATTFAVSCASFRQPLHHEVHQRQHQRQRARRSTPSRGRPGRAAGSGCRAWPARASGRPARRRSAGRRC